MCRTGREDRCIYESTSAELCRHYALICLKEAQEKPQTAQAAVGIEATTSQSSATLVINQQVCLSPPGHATGSLCTCIWSFRQICDSPEALHLKWRDASTWSLIIPLAAIKYLCCICRRQFLVNFWRSQTSPSQLHPAQHNDEGLYHSACLATSASVGIGRCACREVTVCLKPKLMQRRVCSKRNPRVE